MSQDLPVWRGSKVIPVVGDMYYDTDSSGLCRRWTDILYLLNAYHVPGAVVSALYMCEFI